MCPDAERSYDECCFQPSGLVKYSLLLEPVAYQRSVGVTQAVGYKVSRGRDALCSGVTVWEYSAMLMNMDVCVCAIYSFFVHNVISVSSNLSVQCRFCHCINISMPLMVFDVSISVFTMIELDWLTVVLFRQSCIMRFSVACVCVLFSVPFYATFIPVLEQICWSRQFILSFFFFFYFPHHFFFLPQHAVEERCVTPQGPQWLHCVLSGSNCSLYSVFCPVNPVQATKVKHFSGRLQTLCSFTFFGIYN